MKNTETENSHQIYYLTRPEQFPPIHDLGYLPNWVQRNCLLRQIDEGLAGQRLTAKIGGEIQNCLTNIELISLSSDQSHRRFYLACPHNPPCYGDQKNQTKLGFVTPASSVTPSNSEL